MSAAENDTPLEVGHYSLNMDRSIPEGTGLQQPTPPYAEGSQPPRLSHRDLTQMDAVVGGQAVRKQQAPEERKGNSIDPKQATHGDADKPSAMELGEQIMGSDLSTAGEPASSGLAGQLDNQQYQEASQVPQVGATVVQNVPNVVGGQHAEPNQKKPSSTGKKPNIETGEAISAVVPKVEGGEDAARIAKRDIQNAVHKQGSGPTAPMDRLSEERTSTADRGEAVQRPAAERQMEAKESDQHVQNLLGNSLTGASGPKGLGSAQLPKHRPEEE